MKKVMTKASAKSHVFELLLEPLKGCKRLYNFKQDLMRKIMQMSGLQVREYLDCHERCGASGSCISLSTAHQAALHLGSRSRCQGSITVRSRLHSGFGEYGFDL